MTDREKIFDLMTSGRNPAWCYFPDNSAILEFVDYLISCGVTVQQWVPVSEQLPDKELWEYQKKYNQDNMEVLVMIKGAKEPTTLYYCDDGDFNDDEGNSWLVTHWMPLPEPPKEV